MKNPEQSSVNLILYGLYVETWHAVAPRALSEFVGEICLSIPESQRASQQTLLTELDVGQLHVSHSSPNSPLQVSMTFPPSPWHGRMPFWVRKIDGWRRHGLPEETIALLGLLEKEVQSNGRKVSQLHKRAVDLDALRQPRLDYISQSPAGVLRHTA